LSARPTIERCRHALLLFGARVAAQRAEADILGDIHVRNSA
jgi:hypothetical protein